MFCIKCFNKTTKVTNSRPNKKQPIVWRRRVCPKCGSTFTTYERPSLADNKPIYLETGKTVPFNLGKLTLSISKSFTHSIQDAQYSSIWLAQSVEDILSSQVETITLEDIEAITHDILQKFDTLAAIQYAAQHHMITSAKRRRGRPSWHEPEPPTDG